MEENEIEDDERPIEVNCHHDALEVRPVITLNHTDIGLTLGIVAMSLIAGCCLYLYQDAEHKQPKACEATNAVNKAQIEAQTAQINAGAAASARIQTMQLKSMDACAARGGVPYVQGNQYTGDCRFPPK